MKDGLRRVLFWLPRILSILLALFLSLFALDVFREGRGFWGTLGALLVHLIPVYLVLLVLAVAWRWEWVGAVAYLALAVLYVTQFWGRFHWSAYVVVAGPLVLVGALFAAGWVYRDSSRTR